MYYKNNSQSFKVDELKENNDSLFRDDELDKTIVYFDIGCADKDEIEKSDYISKSDEQTDEMKSEENKLKKFLKE